MSGLIIRRLVQMPLILFVIYTITFCLAWLIPGNPLENPDCLQLSSHSNYPPREILFDDVSVTTPGP